VFRGQPDYPKQLGQISDAPPLIWARGDLGLAKRPVTALVARATPRLWVARWRAGSRMIWGRRGICIVSGLARGIDAAAHQAALETGTIAILSGGLKTIYPPNIKPSPPSSPNKGSCFQNNPLICARKRITFPFEIV